MASQARPDTRPGPPPAPPPGRRPAGPGRGRAPTRPAPGAPRSRSRPRPPPGPSSCGATRPAGAAAPPGDGPRQPRAEGAQGLVGREPLAVHQPVGGLGEPLPGRVVQQGADHGGRHRQQQQGPLGLARAPGRGRAPPAGTRPPRGRSGRRGRRCARAAGRRADQPGGGPRGQGEGDQHGERRSPRDVPGQPASTRRAVTTRAASATTTTASPATPCAGEAMPRVARNRRCDGATPTARPARRPPPPATAAAAGRWVQSAIPTRPRPRSRRRHRSAGGRLDSRPVGQPDDQVQGHRRQSPAARGRPGRRTDARARRAAVEDRWRARRRRRGSPRRAPPRPDAARPGARATSPASAHATTSPTPDHLGALRPSSPTSSSPPRASPAPTAARAATGGARRSCWPGGGIERREGPSMVGPSSLRSQDDGGPGRGRRPRGAARRPGWRAGRDRDDGQHDQGGMTGPPATLRPG